VIHLPEHELFLVTEDSKSVYYHYNGALGKYPEIHWLAAPAHLAYLKPCTIVAFYTNCEIDVRNLITGETELLMKQFYTTLCWSPWAIFLHTGSSIIRLVTEKIETKIVTFLQLKNYPLAISISEDCKPSLVNRARLEYGIHLFMNERKFSKAAVQLELCKHPWVVCSLFRSMIKLPPYLYKKSNALILDELAKITNYTVPKGDLQLLVSEERFLSREHKLAAMNAFIPLFNRFRKTQSPEFIRNYADALLFDVLLTLPGRHLELMSVVGDSANTLALAYCERILIKRGMYNVLIELYISRRCYKRPLEILFQQYNQESNKDWLLIIKYFLSKMTSDESLFLEYVSFLY
jgi:hypothetical protein